MKAQHTLNATRAWYVWEKADDKLIGDGKLPCRRVCPPGLTPPNCRRTQKSRCSRTILRQGF